MPGPRVVALGDSITVGVGDGVHSPTGDHGWAAHVAHARGAGTFLNLAANGTRARHVVERQLDAAEAADPDVVLATIGGNDVLRGDFDPRDIRAAVAEAVGRLDRPGRRIVVASLDRIGLFDLMPRAISEVMARRVGQANAALVSGLRGTSAVLLDSGTIMTEAGKQAWHVDRVHPSSLGHRAIAGAAIAQLALDYVRVNDVTPAAAPPRLPVRAWWLVRNGAPWVVKRSRDLIPQVAAVVTHELLEERRQRVRA